jgi:hypothetical protein
MGTGPKHQMEATVDQYVGTRRSIKRYDSDRRSREAIWRGKCSSDPTATNVGCMAHSRRRFVEALKTRKNGGGPPEQALRFFEQLYRVEKQAKDKVPDAGETRADCIRRFRQQHSLPVLNALKAWLNNIASKIVPDTKLGDAVSYTLWSVTSDFLPPEENRGCSATPLTEPRPAQWFTA